MARAAAAILATLCGLMHRRHRTAIRAPLALHSILGIDTPTDSGQVIREHFEARWDAEGKRHAN